MKNITSPLNKEDLLSDIKNNKIEFDRLCEMRCDVAVKLGLCTAYPIGQLNGKGCSCDAGSNFPCIELLSK